MIGRVFFTTALLLFASHVRLSGENILLISIDTLRADRLSCYGYRGNRTPNIDRVAIRGALFEQAYTETPLTLPAHSTLFSGVTPLVHGVRENAGFRLPTDVETLAEVLAGSGYETVGVIGSYVLASEFGIAQGFETYMDDFEGSENELPATALQKPASEVAATFLKWLDDNQQKRFFAFVHFYDPHMPRRNGYDWEVRQVDRAIGSIIDHLDEHRLLRSTHLVILSDHGESLGEHGEQGHGYFLYDATLHIPLIISPAGAPRALGRRIKAPVSLVDVMPTVLDLAQVQKPTHLQGKSLMDLIQGKGMRRRPLYAESYIPSFHVGARPLKSIRLNQLKLIDSVRPELYDLGSDPAESVNLFEARKERGLMLRTRLTEYVQTHSAGTLTGYGEVNQRAIEKLASLGYLRASARRFQEPEESVIDAKDRIRLFEDYHLLVNAASAPHPSPELLREVSRLRQTASDLKGLTFYEAQILEKLDRLSESEEKYRQAFLEDHNTLALARRARVLIRMKRYEEAEEALLEVLDRDPSDFRSRNNLAGIYQMSGRNEKALGELERIVATHPDYAAGWNNLGQMYGKNRRWEEAEKAFRRVISIDPRNGLARYRLAFVLRATGRLEEAGRQMERAIQLNPSLQKPPDW